jgi:hypothetical protein
MGIGFSSAIPVHIKLDDIKQAGWLVKESRDFKILRRRWCVLTSEYLCSFKVEGDHRRATEVLRLDECTSVTSADSDTGQENSLHVATEERTFFFIADSASEKEAWITAITNFCLPALVCGGTQCDVSLFSIYEKEEDEGKCLVAHEAIDFDGSTFCASEAMLREITGSTQSDGEAMLREITESTQSNFHVGDNVYARTSEAEAWVCGSVVSVDPLQVLPEGKEVALSFEFVQHCL